MHPPQAVIQGTPPAPSPACRGHGLRQVFSFEPLLLPQSVIQSACSQKLLVRARLHHAALLQDDNPVRGCDRRQPVGDQERDEVRPGPDDLIDGPGYLFLRLRVQGARCLIEDEDVRLPKERAGDGQSLPLPSGELQAAFADPRIQSLAAPFQEAVQLGGPQALDARRVACLPADEAKVVADGPGESSMDCGTKPTRARSMS